MDHAPVYRDWDLPAAFLTLRVELERRHGVLAGTRQFIRVLQLLGEHPQSRVEQAIDECRGKHAGTAEAIVQRTRSLAARGPEPRSPAAVLGEAAVIPRIEVPRPDLSRFNQLLTTDGPDGDDFAERGSDARNIDGSLVVNL